MILARALPAFLFEALLFLGAGFGAQMAWKRARKRPITTEEGILLGAGAPALLGYAAFCIYFASPAAGHVFSWAVMAASAAALVWVLWRRQAGEFIPNRDLVRLGIFAGCGYMALLLAYPSRTFTTTANDRLVAHMAGDNLIPQIVTELTYDGARIVQLGGDWQTSDRPPLQTGITLLVLPALRAAGVDFDVSCATVGVWFQLLWVPALWLFLRWLGVGAKRAVAGCAALAFTGFLIFNTVFVWPKLGGAALVLMAFCTFFRRGGNPSAAFSAGRSRRFAAGGAFAALGNLSHGGVMFSLLGLGVVGLAWYWRWWRGWLGAVVVFAVLSTPWICYQHFYAPPGNRLVKWHIAGVIPVDNRGVLAAMRDRYREIGWSQALAARRINLDMMFRGRWGDLLSLKGGADALARRSDEWAYPLRAVSGWILGLCALPFAIGRWARRDRAGGARHALAVAWLALGLAAWVGLMFFPNMLFVFAGSLATQLIFLGLLVSWPLLVSRWLFAALAALQCGLFLTTWTQPSPAFTMPPDRIALSVAVASGLAVATLCVRNLAGSAE